MSVVLCPEKSTALIEGLGGTCAVARDLGLPASTVSHWKTKGMPAAHVRIIKLLHPRHPAVKAIADFRPWITNRPRRPRSQASIRAARDAAIEKEKIEK